MLHVFVILIKGLRIWILVLHELHSKLMVFWYAVFWSNFTKRFSFGVVGCFVWTFLSIWGSCLACCIYIRFFTSSWRPLRCFCCFVSSCWLCSWQHLFMLLEYFAISQQLLSISVHFVWRLRTDTQIFCAYLWSSINLYVSYRRSSFSFSNCSITWVVIL